MNVKKQAFTHKKSRQSGEQLKMDYKGCHGKRQLQHTLEAASEHGWVSQATPQIFK